jgi:hypothetical protein
VRHDVPDVGEAQQHERDAKDGVEDGHHFAPVRLGGDVAVACGGEGERGVRGASRVLPHQRPRVQSQDESQFRDFYFFAFETIDFVTELRHQVKFATSYTRSHRGGVTLYKQFVCVCLHAPRHRAFPAETKRPHFTVHKRCHPRQHHSVPKPVVTEKKMKIAINGKMPFDWESRENFHREEPKTMSSPLTWNNLINHAIMINNG